MGAQKLRSPRVRNFKGREQLQPYLSGSDTDSDEPGRTVSEALYRSLQLAAALHRPADFATAVKELVAIMRVMYSSRCSKPVQVLIAQDVALAIECCDTCLQSRAALTALMEAAERHLPQAKRKELARQYRRSSVQLLRHKQRQGCMTGAGAGPGDGDEESDSEAEEPATFSRLPLDVTADVLRYLDPITLARAACVSREWRAATSAETLWQQHCANASGGCAGSGGSSYRQQFAATARQRPEELLRWRTNRVLDRSKLGWLEERSQPRAWCRHVGTATVLAYLKSGGRRYNSRASSSSEDDSGSGETEPALRARLKFWQL